MKSHSNRLNPLFIAFMVIISLFLAINAQAEPYQRNKAVPVEKVLFGKVLSVRKITETELIEDKNSGWKTLGGALIGGVIGHQFGSGSGQDAATVLGAIIGASAASNSSPEYQQQVLHLIELMIRVEGGEEYMVVQDYDTSMLFQAGDKVRMIYLANSTVRVDKDY